MDELKKMQDVYILGLALNNYTLTQMSLRYILDNHSKLCANCNDLDALKNFYILGVEGEPDKISDTCIKCTFLASPLAQDVIQALDFTP